jgi:hypothetical protein
MSDQTRMNASDPCRLAAQTQVIRVVTMVAAKVGVEAARGRERGRVLAEMARDLRDRDKA